MSRIHHRSGVFSLARYDPTFFPEEEQPYNLNLSETKRKHLIQYRACKTMTHEISHMFGIKHCVYFECIMNGSNKIQEADIKPPYMCPVCLRKLKYMCKFSYFDLYSNTLKLLDQNFSENSYFKPYREFLKDILQIIEDGTSPSSDVNSSDMILYPNTIL